jgi:transcriptional regulator with XRE-family HTH domain
MKSQPTTRTFDILKAQKLLAVSGKGYPELGDALGLTRQAVGHWFRGRGEPDVQQMKKMAEVMGCHWLDLCTDETTVLYLQDEREHMAAWRALSPDAKALFSRAIAAEAEKKP